MKLLVVTQKVAQNDPVLGFFHTWLREFALNFEKVTVVCLEQGEYDLPGVKVLSLGKEPVKHSVFDRFWYIWRFYQYIWSERKNYDVVFVHMNQEYVILGWKSWFLLRKKIFLWRNHAKGNFLTRLAVLLSHKVFYTSPSSYTARFKKAVRMPVGIDTSFFKPDPVVQRMPNSVLFLGRISPVKKVLEFVEWVKEKGYEATIAGPILDQEYGALILEALTPQMQYLGSVDQAGARKLYQTHEIYANFTPRGSMDKAIFEAAACGCKLEIRNPEAKQLLIEDHSLKALMDNLCLQLK